MSEITGLNTIQDNSTTWAISLEGTLVNKLQNSRNMPQGDEFDRAITTASRILSHCPNPNDRNPRRTTVLALGRIQSGKTASYTALIGLAIQSGYKTIIVLAGTTNEILNQTLVRLNDLGSYPQDMSSTIHLFTNNLGNNQRELIRAIIDRQGHTVLIVAIKRNVHQIIRLLDGTTANNPTLIIDDEGDQASLNTNQGSEEREASFVNRNINKLREILPVHGYVSYTATPNANILLSKLDSLHPGYTELVEPGSAYCGGSVFFGSEQNDFVRIVPQEEVEAGSAAITPSLEIALATFMVGAGIRRLRAERHGTTTPPYAMLIHASQLQQSHSELFQAVRGLIEEWKNSLALRQGDPALQGLEAKFRAAYDDFVTTANEIPSWEEVFSRVRDSEIRYIDLRIINASKQNVSPSVSPYVFENIIVVGGEKLGRGITIPGLAISYLVRETATMQADTLEQRARWFGYRQDYLDLCRVFLTSTLRDVFHHLTEFEDDLWERLRRNQQQGLPFDKWEPMLKLNMEGLLATRPNVVNVKTFDPQGWNTETKPSTNVEDANYNVDLVKTFLNNHSGSTKAYGRVSHKIIEGCSINDLVELLTKVHYTSSNWDLGYYVEYLMRLNEGGRLSNMDIIFMNGGESRDRTAQADGSIPIGYLMQGHSDNIPRNDPNFYPGDENIHGGNPQFQVHILNYNHNGQRTLTTAFALYIPVNNELFNLAYIVRDDEYES